MYYVHAFERAYVRAFLSNPAKCIQICNNNNNNNNNKILFHPQKEGGWGVGWGVGGRGAMISDTIKSEITHNCNSSEFWSCVKVEVAVLGSPPL